MSLRESINKIIFLNNLLWSYSPPEFDL